MFVLGNFNICNAQNIAIGHITAEVIESLSASLQATTSLPMESTNANNSLSSGRAAVTSPTLNLGTMQINSGSNATVNVLLKSATLSDSLGNDFTLDPSFNNNSTTSVTQSNGSQNIKLTGIANLNFAQASGLYQGSYPVDVAYN